jgi:hypothetical protein
VKQINIHLSESDLAWLAARAAAYAGQGGHLSIGRALRAIIAEARQMEISRGIGKAAARRKTTA